MHACVRQVRAVVHTLDRLPQAIKRGELPDRDLPLPVVEQVDGGRDLLADPRGTTGDATHRRVAVRLLVVRGGSRAALRGTGLSGRASKAMRASRTR